MKIALAVVATLASFLLFTVIFVFLRIKVQTPGTGATAVNLIRAWTIYSPLYWIIAIVAVAGTPWLLMRRQADEITADGRIKLKSLEAGSPHQT
jgi:hypothetical protein